MPQLDASVSRAIGLAHDGWAFLSVVLIMTGVAITISFFTRSDGLRDGLIAPRILLPIFFIFWLIACLQDWKSIQQAGTVSNVFLIRPFLLLGAAAIVFLATFALSAFLDRNAE